MGESLVMRPKALRGVLMVIAAVAIFSVIDVLSKYLTRFYPVTLIVWARYTFHLIFVVMALAPRLGFGLVRTSRPGAQFLRGLLLASSSVLFVSALKYMPLAESTAIAFLSPLFIT
ncbi:MAG: EamA/RhaT family transporter, partial [Betaproteobacteria bacterium]